MKRSRSLSHRVDRHEHDFGLQDEAQNYPMNLSIKNLVIFLMLPTLCYEIDFPRTENIRIDFLLRRGFEIAVLINIEVALIQQWIMPILDITLPNMKTNLWIDVIENYLRLLLPNHIIWIVGFYLLFHSFCNFTGEIFQFADREFYRDWWNAKDVIKTFLILEKIIFKILKN